MNEETFNLSVRRIPENGRRQLTAREIEHAVAKAIESGRIGGSESFPANVTLHVGGIDLDASAFRAV